MNTISPPPFDTLYDYYKSYWKYLNDDDLILALTEQETKSVGLLSSIPAGMENFIYADGKWMLKEVVGHLCDTERILSYRALRFSRNDKTALQSFDENAYAQESNYRSRTLSDILEEWKTIRSATISLFTSMTEEMADRIGTANNVTVSARVLLYFILVHERHHLEIIKERYLSSALHAG